MKNIASLITFLLCAVSHAAPGPLIVTAGGWYTGSGAPVTIIDGVPYPTYTTYSIRTAAPVTLNHLYFTAIGADTGTDTARANVSIWNCIYAGTPPHYSNVFWRFETVDIKHCRFISGAGNVFMDGNAKSFHFAYNDGLNISGMIDATHAEKTSFVQLDQVHCPDIYIGWNRCTNTRGKSAVEDVISMNQSGGTSASPAIIENNLVDGEYEWPVGSHPSGSGLMLFDPAASNGSSEGGWTIGRNNNVLNCANVGIDAAGSHGIQIIGNVLTAHGIPLSTAPARTWNWNNKTPSAWFGPFIATGNQASWFSGAHQCNFIWAEPQTTATGNTYPTISDDDNRAMWAAKVKAAGVFIGPVPQATSTVQALSYVAASSGIKNVPLPSEHLGMPTSIGWTTDGQWSRYSAIDFSSGMKTWTASVGCQNSSAGHAIELHLDAVSGPLIGTLKVAGTGSAASSWYAYQDQSCAVTGATGTHDLVLVFSAPGSTQGVANVASFSFK